MVDFIHLHTHDAQGSMLDSINRVEDLFKRASELGMKSLAISNHGTLASLFDARKYSKKYGVDFIPGMEAYFVDDVSLKYDKKDPRTKRRHIVLLAKNEVGYQNLLQLNWKGFQNNQYLAFLNKIFPRIDWKMLEEHSEGIICLTACGSGLVSRQMFVHDEDGHWLKPQCHKNIREVVGRLKGIFGEDLYLEVQPHNLKIIARERKTGQPILGKDGNEIVVVDQNHINQMLIEASKEMSVPLVATADIHYLNKEDAKAHDMLMAISEKAPLSDKLRHRYEVEEFYFKTGQEIYNHFLTHFNDEGLATEVCANTIKIADKCEPSDYLDTFEPRFPQFDISIEKDYKEFRRWNSEEKKKGVDISDDHAYMRFKCVKAFKNRMAHLKGAQKKEYMERIKKEISVLEYHNFSSYMLMVADYIEKAREQGIPIGPGRGSVCGSLVAYLLDIHDVDPIKYGLLFERFHNVEKKSFPDIDTDIHPDGRKWIQNYIADRYGKEKVAHVSNLSTMTPKVVIKDIARSLEIGGDKSSAFKVANKITDTIPDDAKTFDDAFEASKELRRYCNQFPELEDYGRKLVGLERAYATHAAGVVVGDIDLSTYIPLRLDKDGNVAVQYEKERCESLGLIKMDLLGLEHLKIIDNTIKNIRKLGQEPIMPRDLEPYDDEEVWKDIQKGRTLCVFQMGSNHMRALCKGIRPESIEDLSLVNALGRPSAKRSRESYIARRNGEKVSYKYAILEKALGDTLGVCVYEEQLAKFANIVAGWDLNKADGLRKMTKYKGKHPEMVEKLYNDFVEGAVETNGLTKKQAEDIWDMVAADFEGYGFNKSHGIAYSINGYQTAYYQHYYPAAFMAAVLASEAGKGSSPVRDANLRLYKRWAKAMGLSIEAPDINASGLSYSVKDEKTIVTGLAAIKGVGERAVENIIETRDSHLFKSYHDFLLRTKSNLVRKNVIQPLAKAGCFDSLKITRKNAHDHYDVIRKEANKHYKKVAEEGRLAWKVLDDMEASLKYDPSDEWALKEKLMGEQETIGEYLSGNIGDLYEGFFAGINTTPLTMVKSLSNNQTIKVEAVVMSTKEKKTKKAGKPYLDCQIQDIKDTSFLMRVWSEQMKKYQKVLRAGVPIRAVCKVNVWAGGTSLVLQKIEAAGG